MQRLTLQSFFLKSGWAVLTAGSLFLFSITTLYFSFCSDCNFLLEKQDVVHNPFWRTAFYIHITGGMLALVTGPWQFLRVLRRRYMRLHRTLGKIYLGSILFLAAPSGHFMSYYAEGGVFSAVGFLVMSFLWFWTTWKAYATVRLHDIQGHKDWMTRSMALTLAAVTLRVWVPFASYYLGLEQDFVVESSAWVSWVPNLVVAEVLVRTRAIRF
jgi:uncharacterized membrane protein